MPYSITNDAKAKLDALGIDDYSTNEISDYAAKKYKQGRFDEAYVEYRVKRKIGG